MDRELLVSMLLETNALVQQILDQPEIKKRTRVERKVQQQRVKVQQPKITIEPKTLNFLVEKEVHAASIKITNHGLKPAVVRISEATKRLAPGLSCLFNVQPFLGQKLELISDSSKIQVPVSYSSKSAEISCRLYPELNKIKFQNIKQQTNIKLVSIDADGNPKKITDTIVEKDVEIPIKLPSIPSVLAISAASPISRHSALIRLPISLKSKFEVFPHVVWVPGDLNVGSTYIIHLNLRNCDENIQVSSSIPQTSLRIKSFRESDKLALKIKALKPGIYDGSLVFQSLWNHLSCFEVRVLCNVPFSSYGIRILQKPMDEVLCSLGSAFFLNLHVQNMNPTPCSCSFNVFSESMKEIKGLHHTISSKNVFLKSSKRTTIEICFIPLVPMQLKTLIVADSKLSKHIFPFSFRALVPKLKVPESVCFYESGFVEVVNELPVDFEFQVKCESVSLECNCDLYHVATINVEKNHKIKAQSSLLIKVNIEFEYATIKPTSEVFLEFICYKTVYKTKIQVQKKQITVSMEDISFTAKVYSKSTYPLKNNFKLKNNVFQIQNNEIVAFFENEGVYEDELIVNECSRQTIKVTCFVSGSALQFESPHIKNNIMNLEKGYIYVKNISETKLYCLISAIALDGEFELKCMYGTVFSLKEKLTCCCLELILEPNMTRGVSIRCKGRGILVHDYKTHCFEPRWELKRLPILQWCNVNPNKTVYLN